MGLEHQRTVRQFAKENPAYPEGRMRWIIFNKDTNGFAPAIKKVGGRVLIDTKKFEEIVDQQSAQD